MVRTPLGQGKHESLQHSFHNREPSIRILTHNIRYTPSSRLENERPWADRYPLIMNQFLYHTRFLIGSNGSDDQHPDFTTLSGDCKAAFICIQEALHHQLHDMLGSLNNINREATEDSKDLPQGPTWAHIGVAREDGRTKGEYCPIIYPVRVFNLLHFENTWLSPTPDKPSRGWDAGCVRILTTGVFEHKATKKRLAVFNTHLDHAGTEARQKSVGVIIGVIERVRAEWSIETNDPTSEGLEYILAGDFNSFPTQEAYKAIVASDKMVDVHEAVPAVERYGSEVTFTGFQPSTGKDKNEIGRIDFVWLGPKSRVHDARAEVNGRKATGWNVEGYSVLPNVFDDGIFCSDHRCVVADALLSSG